MYKKKARLFLSLILMFSILITPIFISTSAEEAMPFFTIHYCVLNTGVLRNDFAEMMET